MLEQGLEVRLLPAEHVEPLRRLYGRLMWVGFVQVLTCPVAMVAQRFRNQKIRIVFEVLVAAMKYKDNLSKR